MVAGERCVTTSGSIVTLRSSADSWAMKVLLRFSSQHSL